jgi:hypothetical protein
MAILLGPLPEVVEHKSRQWFVRLDARKWRPISWHNLTDMEKRAIDRMCTCGVAQQRVREVFEVDGVEHTLRAVLSGDCADRFGAEYYEQMIAHFGRGRNITTRMEMEIEAVRLTAAGQAIRERNNLKEDLSTALNGSYFPAPGCVEWLGWEISSPPAAGEEATATEQAVASQPPAVDLEPQTEPNANQGEVQRLLSVFTDGMSDDRIARAAGVLTTPNLTVNDKLTQIDRIIPLPATASADQLGSLLRVTRQAVLKSDWWIQYRKGEKASEVGRRREVHRRRAQQYEPDQPEDEVT